MIFENPTDDTLRAADVIALFDRNYPGWHEIIASTMGTESMSPKEFLIVDIPVNAMDWASIRNWRMRIDFARNSGQPATVERLL